MRSLASVCLLMLSACSGIQIGGSDDEVASPDSCVERSEEISTPNLPASGFAETPSALLAAATGQYAGTLTLSDARTLALSIQMSGLRSFRKRSWRTSGTGAECQAPVLEADLDLNIDAGEVLSGSVSAMVQLKNNELEMHAYPGSENIRSTLLSPAEQASGTTNLLSDLRYQNDMWSGEFAFLSEQSVRRSIGDAQVTR